MGVTRPAHLHRKTWSRQTLSRAFLVTHRKDKLNGLAIEFAIAIRYPVDKFPWAGEFIVEINKRKLESLYYLVGENISFDSDAIGAVSPDGRSAATAWLADEEMVFKGKLKHILTFALMAFDVASVAVNELYTIIPERDFLNVRNLGDTDIVDVVDLDPTAGEGIVQANDITFMTNLTNNLRGNWSEPKRIITANKVTPTTRAYYNGSLVEALAYGLQFQSGGTAPIYTLFDFAVMDISGLNKGVVYADMDGALGPVELEKAHVTLANTLLGVT
jgi:hypothetical protein